MSITVQERIEDLRAQHQDLERMLTDESSRHHSDDQQITEWKKQKLAIKDQIASLTASS